VPRRVRGNPRGRRLLDLDRQACPAGRAARPQPRLEHLLPPRHALLRRRQPALAAGDPGVCQRRLRSRRHPPQLLHPLPHRRLPSRRAGERARVAVRVSLVRLALPHLVRAAGRDRIPRRGHGRLPRPRRRQLVGAQPARPAGGRPSRLRAAGYRAARPPRADRALRREPPLPARGRGSGRGGDDAGAAGRARWGVGAGDRGLLQRAADGLVSEHRFRSDRRHSGSSCEGTRGGGASLSRARRAAAAGAAWGLRAGVASLAQPLRIASAVSVSRRQGSSLERRVVPDLGTRCRFPRLGAARESGGRDGRAG
jgi:hypothetical protein